jgi:capsular exopolysaccharide synthesis family protein
VGWFNGPPVAYADLIADAGKRIKVRAVGSTRIVEVLCEAQDGQLAASLCNTLAKTYIENNLGSRVESTKETSDWLQSQLDDVRTRLTKAENDLKEAGKTTDFGATVDGAESPAQDRLRQLQAELSRSQVERIAKESNYSVAANRDTDFMPPEMDAGAVREYKLKLADLRRQLSELSATLTPEHYRVRELTMQIAEVQRSLESEREGAVQRLRADLDAARRRESMISAAYDTQVTQVSQRGDKAVRYSMIKHDVDSERQLYETLLQKVGEVGLAAAMRTSTISVVDPAVASLHPYSPNTLANLAVGFFGGAVLGLALSLFRARSDETLRSPGDARLLLQVRELGVIPSIRSRGLSLRFNRSTLQGLVLSTRRTPSPEEQTSAEAMLMPRMSPRSIALATWLRVPEIAEAFFGTMNSILRACEGTGRNSVPIIVTTSPEVGDGKTTVATNLAIAFAQTGHRVVLVDGDLRKPRLHTIFDTSDENGLASFLEVTGPVDNERLSPLVSETQIPNLHVITTKPAHEGISTKLHSPRMRQLFKHLRTQFELVIVDSPPMLDISDARVLGGLADGVMLVFRAGKTTRESALAAHDCLAQDGIRVFGTVLNDWHVPRERYATYSSYFHVG